VSDRRPPEHAIDLSLPTDRTFVVQFGRCEGGSAEPGPGGFAHGRVEHLTTGRAIRFGTWDELCVFVEHVLQPSAGAQRDPTGED
jgi:hypothetical protein